MTSRYRRVLHTVFGSHVNRRIWSANRRMANSVALSMAALPAIDRHPTPAKPDGGRVLANERSARLSRHTLAQNTITDAQSIAMAQRWVTLDWVRVGGAVAAFVAPLRALTLPWPQEAAPKDPPLVRAMLALALLGVAAFIVWFVLNL